MKYKFVIVYLKVRTNCRVVSAGREGKSKGEFSREGKSFRLLVEGAGGEEEWLKDFQAVVDCTGTYGHGRRDLSEVLG